MQVREDGWVIRMKGLGPPREFFKAGSDDERD
jgi:hypothetical protein